MHDSTIVNTGVLTTRQRRSQRQRISPSPEPQFMTTVHQLSPLALPYSSTTSRTVLNKSAQMLTDQFRSFSDRPDTSHQPVDSSNDMSSFSLIPSKHLSASDLNPFERKQQIAFAKVQAKLAKAQRLYQSAQLSVEQNISEFLRVTTLPGIINDSNYSPHMTNAAFDKRIRTLQDTRKELEKKIGNYQLDLIHIQAGEIPNQYSSSKDILNNIKLKVSTGISKRRSSNDISNTTGIEPIVVVPTTTSPDSDNQPLNLPFTFNNSTTKQSNHPQSFFSHNNTFEVAVRSSPSNSICHETNNSEYVYDNDKSIRKHDNLVAGKPVDSQFSFSDDHDKSPSTKRRLTDDSTGDFNDHISDHSSDDRYGSFNPSKRNTMTTHECHQLLIQIDFLQKTIDRYESKMIDLQKQLDSLTTHHERQCEQTERLNNDLTDLTDLHQLEMSGMKTDLKKLEDKFVYNLKEFWNEMDEKFEKLDTRTTKVEQTQTHSLETEENTHRIITKLVNILLTVFAIILLLLSTMKNLVQSRVHAIILLILVFTWITIHYLPDNTFHSSFITNFTRLFQQT